MGKLENLKINSQSKSKLYIIKKQFSFTTYSSTIETMCSFFETNKISPKEGINQSYHNSIFEVEKTVKMGLSDLRKQYTKDSQSMRRMIRSIERDHIVNTSSKVSYLYDKSKEKSVDKNVNNSIKSVLNSSENDLEKDREIEELKAIISEKSSEINKLKYAQDSEDNLKKKYEDNLRIIYRKYYTESSFGKEKLIIDMKKEDFDKLFDI
ncbi:BfmA/BtgA family mobilization protein [Streptomyces diastaticus]|uniref:BfmA/BtgA family mobilization protein n=1 Tax=Streptomyces diastaticus TaxID=1956 RepID=UPI0037CEF054